MNLSKSLRNKILLIALASMGLLFTFLVTTDYLFKYKQAEQSNLNYLHAIANTAAVSINADEHAALTKKYKLKDQILNNSSDTVYYKIHQILRNIHRANMLNTSIYTMEYNSLTNDVQFIVSSSDKPFFRHQYSGYKNELKKYYSAGAKINSYKDENGEWLSAFAPIKDNKNNTVAVVQVDTEFTSFLGELRKRLIIEIIASIIVMLIILALMYHFLNNVLTTQSNLYENLTRKNIEINESISYAKHFFSSALVKPEEVSKQIPDSFIFYQPKNVIGGDFYFFSPLSIEDSKCTKYAIGLFDCTGHGVSGAMIAILGLTIVKNIVPLLRKYTPSHALNTINKRFIKQLNTENEFENNHASMDGCVCVVDKINNTLSFSGAKTNLYIFNPNSNDVKIIKADRKNIGSIRQAALHEFHNQTVSVEPGSNIYMFSDGIVDQYVLLDGKNKKLKLKPFINYLQSIKHLKMPEQLKKLSLQFNDWKKNNDQTDDITVMGFAI